MMTVDEIAVEAERLGPEERIRLIQRLQATLDAPVIDIGITREQLVAELEQLWAAGEFEHVESLYGKYMGGPGISIEDLHQIATEWESELDEFFGDN